MLLNADIPILRRDVLMNKMASILFVVVISTAMFISEEYFFSILILNKNMNKQNATVWLTILVGALLIALLNYIVFSLLNTILKVKGNIFLWVLSSIISSVVFLILCMSENRDFLEYIDYEKEISYFIILIFSIAVTICTIIVSFFCKLLLKR